MVIRIRKQKKDKQHNGHSRRTNNYLQNTTQKTKDRAPRISLNIGMTSCAPEG